MKKKNWEKLKCKENVPEKSMIQWLTFMYNIKES